MPIFTQISKIQVRCGGKRYFPIKKIFYTVFNELRENPFSTIRIAISKKSVFQPTLLHSGSSVESERDWRSRWFHWKPHGRVSSNSHSWDRAWVSVDWIGINSLLYINLSSYDLSILFFNSHCNSSLLSKQSEMLVSTSQIKILSKLF